MRKDADGACDTAVEMGLALRSNRCTADDLGSVCADEIIVFPADTLNPHKASGGLLVHDVEYELVDWNYRFHSLDSAQADALEDEFARVAFTNGLLESACLSALEFMISAPLSFTAGVLFTLGSFAAHSIHDYTQIGSNIDVPHGHYYVMVAIYKHPTEDIYQMQKTITCTVQAADVCHSGITGINIDTFDWNEALNIHPYSR